MTARIAILALSLLIAAPVLAEEPAPADHAQHHPAAAAEPAAADPSPMEKRMAKMDLRMERALGEVNRLTKRMEEVKATLAQARQAATPEERAKLMTAHGEGLQAVLKGLREVTLGMMSKDKMAGMMGGDKKGGEGQGGMMGDKKGGMMMGQSDKKGGEGPGGMMMGQGDKKGGEGPGGMMGEMDMAGHHELMEKRLILLFDLMEQMMAHGQGAGR